MGVEQVGRLLLGLGLALAVVGLLLTLLGRLGGLPRVPGDVVIQRPGVTVYFPLGTSLLLSLLLTLLLTLASVLWLRFRR